MDADGSGVTRLTDNDAGDWSPDWSPDGRRIAFTSDRNGNRDIYVMDADGSGATRLTDNDAVDHAPDWSPDGQRIAFHSGRDENWDIYVMNPDGSDIARLTDNDAEDGSPAWSPGGQRIAFSSYFGRNSRIHVKDVGTDIPEPAATTTASPSQERSGSQTESDTARETFEASSPSGYTRVSLTDQGTVWGIPERFTTDSSLAEGLQLCQRGGGPLKYCVY